MLYQIKTKETELWTKYIDIQEQILDKSELNHKRILDRTHRNTKQTLEITKLKKT